MEEELPNKVNANELYAASLSFIYFFSLLAAYYVMRPIREQLAAEVGSSQLPWFFAGTLIATLLLTPLFAWIASRWPRRIIVPLVYLFFICCQLAFVPLLMNQTELLNSTMLGVIFFIWVSVFNLFVVSVFWSFMSDIWNDAQAVRLFPIIALGGTAGALVGPMITRTLVEMTGIAFLMVVSAALLAVAIVCILFLGEWARKHGTRRHIRGNESAIGGGMFDGLKQIFNHPFIRSMAILMVLGDAIGTIAYVLMIDYFGFAFPNDAIARTRFVATIDLSTNTLQVIVQLTLTRWLLARRGAHCVIALWGTIAVIACLGLSLVKNPYAPLLGSMPSVALTLIITRALAYAMLQPALETLFTLVPRNIRYKGKNAVDTVVWRSGDLISSISIHGLQALGVTIAGFGLIGATFLAMSGTIGWSLAKRVEKKGIANPHTQTQDLPKTNS